MLIIVVAAMVLMVEMFNSAIEALRDFVAPQHDAKSGIIKDIAAAVGIAMFTWLPVLGLEVAEMLAGSG